MDAFRIRRAGPADAPALARLRYDFRTELDPAVEEKTAFLVRCTEWMAQRLARGSSWWCWAALSTDAIIGTIWLQLIEKLPNPVGHSGFHGYVSSVYVVPRFRNSGVGSALLRACVAEADSQGLDALFLWPTDRSRPLYQRYGFALRDDLWERRAVAG